MKNAGSKLRILCNLDQGADKFFGTNHLSPVKCIFYAFPMGSIISISDLVYISSLAITYMYIDIV